MRVLVSGAGIAGNTLACFLGRAGISVTLVERDATCLSQGQSIDIEGPARKILEYLDLLSELRSRNTGETGTCFETEQGRPYVTMPMTYGKTPSPTSEFEILRGDLSAMLYDEARKYESVTHVLGKTILKVTKNDEHGVEVQLDDDSTIQADMLVLSDGVWSRLRKANFREDSINFVDKDAWIAFGSIPKIKSDNMMWRIAHTTRLRIMGLRPDQYGGTTRAMLLVMPRDEEERGTMRKLSRADAASQKAMLREKFTGAGWQSERILDGMDNAEDFYFQSSTQVWMKKWYANRIICLGDAAYCPTQFTGMGTTLAITGGYMLAGELARLEPNVSPLRAFEAYESSFKPYVENIMKISSFVPRIFVPDTRWGLRVFRTCLRAVCKLVMSPLLSSVVKDDENEGAELLKYDFSTDKR